MSAVAEETFSSRDRALCVVTLIFEPELNSVELKLQDKYRDQFSFGFRIAPTHRKDCCTCETKLNAGLCLSIRT